MSKTKKEKTTSPAPSEKKTGVRGSKEEQEDIFKLLDKGYDIRDAYKLVRGYVPHKNTIYKARKNYIKRLAERPEVIELAQQAVVDALKMKAVKRAGEQHVPSWQQRLTAAKMVLDRAEPAVTVHHEVKESYLFPVDLDRYRKEIPVEEVKEISE